MRTYTDTAGRPVITDLQQDPETPIIPAFDQMALITAAGYRPLYGIHPCATQDPELTVTYVVIR